MVFLFGVCFFRPNASVSKAGGGVITLSVSDPQIRMGDVFTVVCRVSSSKSISEVDFYVDYNTTVLQFVEGGPRATKEPGGVHIQSLENDEAAPRRTFSLQFMAKDMGEASLFVRDGAHVVDGDGNPISLNTEKLDVTVTESGEETPEGEATPAPSQTPGPEETQAPRSGRLSANNKVLQLTTNAQDMIPAFDPAIKSYDVLVSPETDTFFIDCVLASRRATSRVKGNKELNYGENKVRLIVTAENGDKQRYIFNVTRPDPVLESVPVEEPVITGAAVNTEPLDKEEKNGYSIVLYIIIGLLLIFAVAMISLVRKQRKELEYYYEEEMEEQRETKNDRGSGESDIEGGQVRGEDGDFRYRD